LLYRREDAAHTYYWEPSWDKIFKEAAERSDYQGIDEDYGWLAAVKPQPSRREEKIVHK
jgi:hypothetical protein